MKNKKGFTLVELLAVIAILAILVIIAIPNVIELYTKAKKKTFVTEIQSLYKMSKNEFILKSNEGNTIKEFSSYGENKLSMTGNKMEYCIELNNNGDVKSIKATNGNYYIDITENEIEDLDIDKIYEGNINNFSCENTIYDYDIEEINSKIKSSCFKYQKNDDGIEILDYYDYEDNNSEKNECSRNVIIPKKIDNTFVVSIGSSAFKSKDITSVHFPNTIKEIKSYAFYQNKLSGTLDMRNLKELKVIGSASFMGDTKKSTNTISKLLLPKNVTKILAGAFAYNNIEGELDLSNTSIIELGDTITENYSAAIVGPFYSNKVEKVIFPKSIKLIGNRSFSNNLLSDKLDLSQYTNLEYVSGFSDNDITEFKMPISLITIGEKTFSDTLVSGELDLSYLTNLEAIGRFAFYGEEYNKNNLSKVILPKSLKSMNYCTFYRSGISNPKLTKIVNLSKNEFDWGKILNWSDNSPYVFSNGIVKNSMGEIEITLE
ncbi:MAG: leucine-rich repeat domain-containing protein [Mollicutes bacterium]|nr:leucine-rich repeat domain-containing protein [Mollicutes bacterium]